METTPQTRLAAEPRFRRELIAPTCLAAAALGVAALVARLPLPVASALVIAAVGIAVALAWPYVGLMLFVALLYLRPEDSFPELIGMRLILLAGGAAFLGWAIRCLSARRVPVWPPPLAWMLAFAGWALVSTLPLPPAEIMERATDVARLAIIMVLITQLVDRPRRLHLFCALVVLASAWLAGMTLFRYYGGQALRSAQGFRALGTGAFADPNDTALALVPAVPLAIAGLAGIWQAGRAGAARWPGRLFGGLCLVLLLWAIYLTNSRGGLVALAGTLLVFSALRFGWRGVVVGGLVAAALLLVGPSRIAALSAGDESAAGRIGAWRVGLDLLAARPVAGVGMGRFTDYNELTAHNSFVLALAELGIFGGVCWVALFVSAIWRAILALRAGPDPADSLLAQAALASVAGYLIAAMFLSKTYFEVPFIYLGLLIVIGRQLALTRGLEAQHRRYGRDFAIAAGLTLLGIAAIALLVRVLR
jgi:putative inorganic carbon (HCO3(-)) transporter